MHALLRRLLPIAFAGLSLVASPIMADESTHHYKPGEVVQVWADRAGPYHAPRETYPFEDLPICELWGLTEAVRKSPSFAEALIGRGLPRLSPRIKLQWPNDGLRGQDHEELHEICRMRLTKEASHTIRELIKDQYYYTYEVDGLLAYAFLGEMTGNQEVKFFAHRTFVLEKNGDQLIGVSIVPKEPVALLENKELRLTYDAVWVDSNVSFSDRFNRLYEQSVFQTKIQWFGVVTSGIIVALMVGMIGLILFRTLRHDRDRDESDLLETADGAEYGLDRFDEAAWRLLAKEVFRRPAHLLSHTVICASGSQLMSAAFLASLVAVLRSRWSSQQSLTMSTLLWCYAACQPANGFVGAVLYKSGGGKKWKQTALWQLGAVPLIVVLLALQLNTVHVIFGTTGALSLGEMLKGCLLFLVILLPLHVVGIYLGRRHAFFAKPPVKPNALERPIPHSSWQYRLMMIVLCGALPFGCLVVDAFLILDSMWTFRNFHVYSFLFAILLIYAAAIASSVTTAVYLLLNSEDYRWQWFAVECGASPALYLAAYAVWYKHTMFPVDPGLLQNTAYWTSTALVVSGVAAASAAVGYLSANQFVRKIYTNVKKE